MAELTGNLSFEEDCELQLMQTWNYHFSNKN
jgi:hypothetical protein